MGKAVLVIDIPETCQHIGGNKEHGCPFAGMYCLIKIEDTMEHVKNGTKPDWCPLKPLPEQKEPIYRYESGREKYTDFARGWNACLEAVGGKSNNE